MASCAARRSFSLHQGSIDIRKRFHADRKRSAHHFCRHLAWRFQRFLEISAGLVAVRSTGPGHYGGGGLGTVIVILLILALLGRI
jgi:hypothetical protein